MTGDEAQGTMGRREKEFSHVFSFPPSFTRKNFIERLLVLVARQEFLDGYLKMAVFHSNVQLVNSVLRHPECERNARFEQ